MIARAHVAGVAVALLLGACAQVPEQPLPEVPVSAAWQEALTGWVTNGAPDPLVWDGWWQRFEDEDLDRLQAQLIEQSPDLASAWARYQQVRAAADVQRSGLAPRIGAGLAVQRDRQSELRPLRVLGPNSPDEYNTATVGLDLTYELDLWGRIRQQVEAGDASARAAEADLAFARLALQARLADTLVTLRGLDAELLLLEETEVSFGRALALVERRHRAGIASGLDVSRAEGQLASTRSQQQQLMGQRAVLVHMAAALVGANPSDFVLPRRSGALAVPPVPQGVPSILLQRRPDIASAQEGIRAAQAQLGVAKAAWFPAIVLSARGGFQTSDFARFIDAPNLFWSIGPSLVATLFDGGRRKAEEARFQAALDDSAARYRATVLGAFQQVEDQLALLNHQHQALDAEQEVAAAAARSLSMARRRYEAGAVSYLEVVASQTAELQSRRTELNLVTRQLRSSVRLVQALGGGWELGTPSSAETRAAR